MNNILIKQEYVRLELVKAFGDGQSEQWIDNMVGFVLGEGKFAVKAQPVKITPDNKPTPLTSEQIKEMNWWCGDITDECKVVLGLKGIERLNNYEWGKDDSFDFCANTIHNGVARYSDEYFGYIKQENIQIYFIDGEFYLEDWNKGE